MLISGLKKGTYGYMSVYRRRVLIMGLSLFCLSMAVFLTGYLTTGSRMNYFSVISAVGVLPAAKFIVYFVMASRFKYLSVHEYEQIKELSEFQLYDLYFTGNTVNIMINACVCVDEAVIIYTKDRGLDLKKATEYLTTQLKSGAGMNAPDVKIYQQVEAYGNELAHLKTKESGCKEFLLSSSL